MNTCNEMLGRTLQLTEMMVELADLGDGARKDVGCGVLYGLLRDAAYKIRKIAEQEKEDHIRRGLWPVEKKSVMSRAAIPKQDGGCGCRTEPRTDEDEQRRSKCNPKTVLKQR
ncbi:MAG: hypothetical protein ABSF52_20740 [Syntrophobacteraceae bacterium]|jgi:hypothetical protein